MRRIWITLLLVLCTNGSGVTALLVAPVIIDANGVQVGDRFPVTVHNVGSVSHEVVVSWGWFDQDLNGQVVLLSQDERRETAEDYLVVTPSKLELQPQDKQTLWIAVHNNDFEAIYPVLFIDLPAATVSSRLAVLLLLTPHLIESELEVLMSEWLPEEVVVWVHNSVETHQSFQVTVEAYDQTGKRLDGFELPVNRILPQRSRWISIPISPGVQRLQITGNCIPSGVIELVQ